MCSEIGGKKQVAQTSIDSFNFYILLQRHSNLHSALSNEKVISIRKLNEKYGIVVSNIFKIGFLFKLKIWFGIYLRSGE